MLTNKIKMDNNNKSQFKINFKDIKLLNLLFKKKLMIIKNDALIFVFKFSE